MHFMFSKQYLIQVVFRLKRELDALREREKRGREQIRELYPFLEEVVIEGEIRNEEEDQCIVCHQYCYVSGMVCEKCKPGKVACLEAEHVQKVWTTSIPQYGTGF